jgi:L-fucose isomerase-like protein
MELERLNVGIITTVSGRWPLELPTARDEEYSAWLMKSYPDIHVVKSPKIAVNKNDVATITEYFKKETVDLVVQVIGAFTGDDVATYLGEELKVPIVIWAPHEPPFDGGRLMANALVSATMNTAALYRLGLKYHFIYGDCTDSRIQAEITKLIKVYGALKKLKRTYLGLLGYRPTGFYSSTFDETLIRQKFGIKMEEFDLKVILDKAEQMDASKVEADIAKVRALGQVQGIPDSYLENHSRLTLAIKELITEQDFNALCIKCWPELGNLHFTPCGMIARLADEDFLIGCESDVDATLTMLIQKYLSGKTPFMSDLITIDETENSASFWHCGQAATKLKSPDSDLIVSNHPLAGQGVAFYGTLKPGKVTVARMSKINNEFKLFLVKGEAIPTQYVTKGVMVKVVLEEPVDRVLHRIAEEGVPHHYSLIWDDVAEEMKSLAGVLGIQVIEI